MTDLTRWNRSGLKRFRYVDGNAASYLEQLRQALVSRFPQWDALQQTLPAGETESERLERLEEQYRTLRREAGWETVRSFARASHVLTEHLDAYANEGYLGTATQWENVRRLVEMIGYAPAPPASAETVLALEAKEDLTGTVQTGFQVNYTPPDGGAPLLFETLEDLEIDVALNALRLAGWSKSVTPFSAEPAVQHWYAQEDQEVTAGQVALLHDLASDATAVRTLNAVAADGALTLNSNPPGAWLKGDAELLIVPERVYKPRLNGTGVVFLPEGHGLSVGDVVSWQDGGTWKFGSVEAADGVAVKITGATPGAGHSIYRANTIEVKGGKIQFPSSYKTISTTKSGSAAAPTGVTTITGSLGSYKEVSSPGFQNLYFVPQDAVAVGTVSTTPPESGFVFPGDPGELAGGQWVVGESGGARFALKVSKVEQRESDFIVNFTSNPASLTRLHGPFRHGLRPQGYDRNATALSNPLTIELASLPAGLKVGKTVVLEQESSDGVIVAHKTTLKAIDAGTLTLTTLPAAADGFTVGNTLVRGNVARAGHGEGKPVKVLGSGDATQANQRFTLKEKDVSFVADASMASGVAAAVEIEIAGRSWQQVSALNDSGPTDHHYAVRLTEEGHLDIRFGDGEHGRRLPTGSANVRARYRVGAGLAGNLDAGSLTEPVKPHPLVEAVSNPLPATGGNDREPESSLRENAPGALFTLGRAVSLHDYQHLAERHASVWQALALALPSQGAQAERIEVVVVPAGGGVLGELQGTLEAYLEAAGLPGVQVEVSNHVPVAFDLDVTLQVDSKSFEPALVAEAVRAALLDAFALKRRRLGQPLYLSELYQLIEAVTGVENSKAIIVDDGFPGIVPAPKPLKGPSGSIKVLRPEPRQVLYLDKTGSTVNVLTQEFTL